MFFGVMVDDRAEPETKPGGKDQIETGDHTRGEDRFGFEKNPKRYRKPHREVGDVGDETIGENLMKRLQF